VSFVIVNFRGTTCLLCDLTGGDELQRYEFVLPCNGTRQVERSGAFGSDLRSFGTARALPFSHQVARLLPQSEAVGCIGPDVWAGTRFVVCWYAGVFVEGGVRA
jgi:hypothetical protein